MFVYAASAIGLALVFYTVGVWSEKKQGSLKLWHVIIFWIGLLLDTFGTRIMGRIAGGVFKFNLHGITGLTAIIVMLFHVLWATVVLLRNNEKMKLNFHKFSILVWCIWLVPIFVGMIYGVGH